MECIFEIQGEFKIFFCCQIEIILKLIWFFKDFLGEDDCIPSCNEVSYKITATTTAKFPGTQITDGDFTRAARNLLSNLTKNLNDRYKKYVLI